VLIEFPASLGAEIVDWLFLQRQAEFERAAATHGVKKRESAIQLDTGRSFLQEEKVDLLAALIEVVQRSTYNSGNYMQAIRENLQALLPTEAVTSPNVEAIVGFTQSLIPSISEDLIANIKAVFTPQGTHYGVNLALGGTGNKHPISGQIITNNGENGHLYVYHFHEAGCERQALLIGIEQSAPGCADPYGGQHDMWASAKTVSVTAGDFFGKDTTIVLPDSTLKEHYRGLSRTDINRYYDNMVGVLDENIFSQVKQREKRLNTNHQLKEFLMEVTPIIKRKNIMEREKEGIERASSVALINDNFSSGDGENSQVRDDSQDNGLNDLRNINIVEGDAYSPYCRLNSSNDNPDDFVVIRQKEQSGEASVLQVTAKDSGASPLSDVPISEGIAAPVNKGIQISAAHEKLAEELASNILRESKESLNDIINVIEINEILALEHNKNYLAALSKLEQIEDEDIKKLGYYLKMHYHHFLKSNRPLFDSVESLTLWESEFRSGINRSIKEYRDTRGNKPNLFVAILEKLLEILPRVISEWIIACSPTPSVGQSNQGFWSKTCAVQAVQNLVPGVTIYPAQVTA
jgi:Novel toxin 11